MEFTPTAIPHTQTQFVEYGIAIVRMQSIHRAQSYSSDSVADTILFTFHIELEPNELITDTVILFAAGQRIKPKEKCYLRRNSEKKNRQSKEEERKNQQHEARKKNTLHTGWVHIFVEAENGPGERKKKPLHYYII